MEPHERGAILVAAIFDAFISIYNRRVADLLRIASNGTGILPEGELHPDLVNRLANEASKSAGHVLTMCIRALDYCPPNEITFGDFLRALITIDYDLVQEDPLGYRVAFIDSFKRRGIYPSDINSLSVESLRWKRPEEMEFTDASTAPPQETLKKITEELQKFANSYGNINSREEEFYFQQDFGKFFHQIIEEYLKDNLWFEEVTGLRLSNKHQISGIIKDDLDFPEFEIESIRQARRIGPDENVLEQILISITQKREIMSSGIEAPFIFRGGVNLIMDMNDFTLKYAIKRSVNNEERLNQQLAYVKNRWPSSIREIYLEDSVKEPFIQLHTTNVK